MRKALFAAPAHAWGGMFNKLQDALPEYQWQSQQDYQITTLSDFDVVIPTMSRIDAALLQSANRLKLIQQMGAGLEGIDLQAAASHQIAVANVPTDVSGNADSVAELGIYLMIALARQAWAIPGELAAGRLGHPLGTTLKGATAGLIGVGGIGKALAKRLKAFDMRLIGVKRSRDEQLANDLGMDWCEGPDALPKLLAESDYLLLSLPDAAQTHHFMNAARFAMVKPGAKLVNLGRGGLIDPQALLEALQSGRLAGAGLDVFWQEPPDPNHPLFAEKVIATPHIGGITELSLNGIFSQVCDNLKRLAADQPLAHRAV